MALPTYAGDPDNYPDEVRYVADGVGADEADTAPSAFDLADRTAYLSAAIDRRVDGLVAINFPYDTIPPIINLQRDALGKVFEVYDFAFSQNLQTYATLIFDSSDGLTLVYTSTDLHEWIKDPSALTSSDVCTNLVLGSTAALTGGALVWNSVNLKIAKWASSGGFVATPTSLAGSAAIKTNPHGGAYIGTGGSGVFVWGLYDGLNNAIIVTSTTLTSVSRQAFGTVGDPNHIRGPMVMATDATADNTPGTILVAIGNTPENSISQSASYFLTTTDGITFTERVFPAENPGNESFGGIDYNKDEGCFFAASTDMASSTMRVYKSTDGLTWTLVNTIANPGPNGFLLWQVTALASVGTVILVTIAAKSALSGFQYFVSSSDLGKTWRGNRKNRYEPAGSDANRLRAKLRSDNGQISFGNSTHVMGSLVIGEQGQVLT